MTDEATEYFSALWDCKHCGTCDIFARDPKNHEQRVDHCPNCGAAVPKPIDVETRGHEGNPYKTPKEGQWQQLLDNFSIRQGEAGPDWECPACPALNSDLYAHCTSCGHKRGASKKDRGIAEEPPRQEIAPPSISTRDTRAEEKAPRYKQALPSIASSDYYRSKALPIAGSLAVLATLAWAVWFFFFSTSDVRVEVTGLSWERKISVEDFAPRHDGAWRDSIPSDAYNERESQKVHHYNKVQTGTKVVEHHRSRRVQSGSRQECSTENKESGVIKRTCHSVPEYKTEYYTERDTVPVYRDDPVYETWVEYTVNRWKFSRWITASGNNHDAHWPETSIRSTDSALPSIGNERLGERTEHYVVHLREMGSDEPRTWSEAVAFSQWGQSPIGTTFIVRINRVGILLGSLEATTSLP